MAENGGLLRIQSNTEINSAKKAQEDINREPDLIESQLAAHISKAWEINRWAKEEHEDEMLECLRQRNGEYSPDILTAIKDNGGSGIYMMLTATKIRAAVSWIRDILVPANDKPWGLSPTPIPELPQEFMQMIAQRIQQTMPALEPEQGEEQYMDDRAALMRDEAMSALKQKAEDAADKMEVKIEDQLVEGGWDKALSDFIEDFCTFPSAIIKAPIIKKKKNLKWGINNKAIVDDKIYFSYNRVSPFDIYPSPDSSNTEDGDLIERIKFNRRDIYNMQGLDGYNDEAIRAVLQEYGRNGLRDWLWRDYSRARLEGKDKFWMRQDQKTIDGLHYWGSAQGLALLEWGMSPDEIDDPLAEYEIDAIKIGRHIIRAVINKDPLQRRPYHVASYQSVPDGFWGIAIPKLMRDQQRMCNAAARALANNLGIASGPQVEVEIDRLADGETIEQMTPWKIWQVKADKSGRGREAVRFFQPKSNAPELLKVYEEFEKRADDATSIPRYAHGNEKMSGAGATAAGLSMLMNSASKGIKMAISNIDGNVIKQTIEQTFTLNMLYDPDKEIKGDVNIIARGATALLTREQAQMRRSEFLAQTNNEVDMGIIGVEGRIELLRSNAELLDIPVDKLLPTVEEFIKKQEEKAAKEQPPQDPKIVAIQQKGQADKEKLIAEQEQFGAKLKAEENSDARKADVELQKNRDKLQSEYDFKLKMLEEESLQKELDRDLEREKAGMERDKDIQRIREEIKLNRQNKVAEKETETTKTEPAQSGSVFNLTIDNNKGLVKKKIDLTTTGGKLSGATVTEENIEN